MSKPSVFGIYESRNAESAVGDFKEAGFSNADVSVLLPDAHSHEESEELVTANNTKAPEGAAVGAGSGAAVGGALGWLIGIGALSIPGIGPVIAAGPLVATLAGIGIGGALGGFTGSLVGMGMSECEAKHYEGRVRKGGVLVAVHCATARDVERARAIMKGNGAEDIASPSENSSDNHENAA
jgi:hypothetical protein